MPLSFDPLQLLNRFADAKKSLLGQPWWVGCEGENTDPTIVKGTHYLVLLYDAKTMTLDDTHVAKSNSFRLFEKRVAFHKSNQGRIGIAT